MPHVSSSLFTVSRPITLALALLAFSTGFLSSWFSIWVVVELMLIIFLANTQTESEAKLKYFIIQTISSLGWLLSVVAPLPLTSMFFVMLLLKLGLAPLLFWVPIVYTGMDTPSILVLSTVMKLPGIVLISHCTGPVMFITMLTSVLLGSVAGWGTTHMKKLLAWSSVTHTSWVCILMASPMWALLYFTLYSSVLSSFIYTASTLFIGSANQLLHMNASTFISFSCIWMSLAGLPPLLGFMLKWLSVEALAAASGLLAAGYIVIMAVSLYYYLQMVLMSTTSLATAQRPCPPLHPSVITLTCVNMLGLMALIPVA